MPTNAAESFVAFDLETTGLAVAEDRIIEIGAVRFDGAGAVVATFESMVNPFRMSSPAAQAVHGIDPALLAAAPPAEAILPSFVSFLGDPDTTIVLAHHSASDSGFLGRELVRAGMALPRHYVVDTLAWARRRWPEFGNHRLDSLARRFGFDLAEAHRALADSHRVRQIYRELVKDDPLPDRPPLAYPIHDGAGSAPVPRGWSEVAEVMARAGSIQIEYAGGTRGPEPRVVSPEQFAHRGGVAYLVARCHLDGRWKDFQVDRIHRFSITDALVATRSN